MADIQFSMNSQPLNFLRTANFQNENTIANLKGKDGLDSAGVLSKNIFRSWTRTDTEKQANNEVRTALLKALGNAFGLAGMNESDGKVRFSAAFMDRLEQILGKGVFKKSDFGVTGPDGSVTSGKPLTQRRIRAILNKAAEVGATPLNRESVGVYETRLATIAKKINLDAYEAKLKQFASLGDEERLEAEGKLARDFPIQSHFHSVKKAFEFYKDELPTFLRKNPDFDPNDQTDIDNVPDYLRDEVKNMTEYQMFDADKNDYVKYNTLQDVKTYLSVHRGLLVHTENAAPKPSFSSMTDPVKEMTDYVENAITLFVQASVNGFIAADKAGKGTDFIRAASNACIEGKGGELQTYIAKNNLMPQIEGEEQISTAEILEAADASTHNEKTTLDKCIYSELEKFSADAKKAGKKTEGLAWKDVADTVKKALVGKKRPIMISGVAGFVNLMQNGEAVVREVTAEDLDKIGQECMDILGIF